MRGPDRALDSAQWIPSKKHDPLGVSFPHGPMCYDTKQGHTEEEQVCADLVSRACTSHPKGTVSADAAGEKGLILTHCLKFQEEVKTGPTHSQAALHLVTVWPSSALQRDAGQLLSALACLQGQGPVALSSPLDLDDSLPYLAMLAEAGSGVVLSIPAGT